jgi:hypothetical protein
MLSTICWICWVCWMVGPLPPGLSQSVCPVIRRGLCRRAANEALAGGVPGGHSAAATLLNSRRVSASACAPPSLRSVVACVSCPASHRQENLVPGLKRPFECCVQGLSARGGGAGQEDGGGAAVRQPGGGRLRAGVNVRAPVHAGAHRDHAHPRAVRLVPQPRHHQRRRAHRNVLQPRTWAAPPTLHPPPSYPRLLLERVGMRRQMQRERQPAKDKTYTFIRLTGVTSG